MPARKKPTPRREGWLDAVSAQTTPDVVAAALHDTLLDLRRASPEAFAALIDLLVRDGLVRYPPAFLP